MFSEFFEEKFSILEKNFKNVFKKISTFFGKIIKRTFLEKGKF